MALLASILPLYFLIVRVPWRWARDHGLLRSLQDPQGNGFHIIQSMIAVGTGGLTGLGLMEGKQKLFYLPEPQTDFIFAVTCRGTGLVGLGVGRRAVRHLSLPRPAHRLAHARHFRPLPGDRHHRHGGGAGVLQHQRRAGHHADERHSRCRSSPTAARRCSLPWPASGCCSTSPSRRTSHACHHCRRRHRRARDSRAGHRAGTESPRTTPKCCSSGPRGASKQASGSRRRIRTSI